MADDKKEPNLTDGEIPSEPRKEEHEQTAPEEPPKKPKNPRRKWFWAAAILLLLLVLLVVHHFRSKEEAAKKAAAAKPQGASITTGQTKAGDINIYVDALGTVTPVFTVTVYSQITGRVIAVHYTEGQLVQKGDPLVDVDPLPYEATLKQAQGNLEHDEGVLAQAKMDLARYQAAYARNAIAKQQLDDQEQAVRQDEGTVKSDQGTVDFDKVQLDYCHIVAPIAGKVGLRLVDPGNTIFAGSSSTLVVITQLQPITVVFNVSEDDLPSVQAQLKGGRTLTVDAFDRANDKQIESGKLTSLDNQIDTTTGTVKFRATFPNKDFSLYPNQFVNARLLLKTLRKVVLAPTAAVQHNGTEAFVYVVQQNNTVSVQQITTLTSNETVTAVQGVNAGATLATSGFDRLENGALVTVRGPTPQGQTNTGAPAQ
ncbi:MAG TPA: efflux RND transporter periplasmic adaptor subunit [Bryobacteraceae bacterium]|jgi:multidrug efflux system membrane fusion protein|nr:efflux RND transporter periplasmic adaptor subunit [Bryobacteraceae bacterium]